MKTNHTKQKQTDKKHLIYTQTDSDASPQQLLISEKDFASLRHVEVCFMKMNSSIGIGIVTTRSIVFRGAGTVVVPCNLIRYLPRYLAVVAIDCIRLFCYVFLLVNRRERDHTILRLIVRDLPFGVVNKPIEVKPQLDSNVPVDDRISAGLCHTLAALKRIYVGLENC